MDTPPPAPGTTTVVVVEKKRGMGCFGCGCLILIVLVILFLALAGGVTYWTYSKIGALTSSSPATIQTFDGGDNVYTGATQKMRDFDQALQQHQPYMLQLSAEEINTLIARDPDFKAHNIQLFVIMTEETAEIQMSLPTDILPIGVLKGRYLNADVSFQLNFDPASKTINPVFTNARLGKQEAPKDLLPTLGMELSPAINQALQNDPECKKILDQAKSIEIKGGLLTIEIE